MPRIDIYHPMKTLGNARKKLNALALFPIFLGLGSLLFWPSFDSAWLMDDFPVLVNNPDIRSLANFFEDYYPGRPLRELTYLLDYQIFGLQPSGYHLQQIFWHGLNAWLVFQLAIRLSACKPIAWGAALLFLAHPLQVEVVANISHRKDSLALAFCLASLLVYLHGRDQKGRRRIYWLLGALLLWGVALLAKQNALALVAMPVIYELCQPGRLRRKLFVAAVALSIIGVSVRIVYLLNNQDFLDNIGPALSKLGNFGMTAPQHYFLAVFKAWAFMASKLLWPSALTMEYTFPLPTGWLDPWALSGLFGAALVVALFVFARWKSEVVCLSLGWVLVFWLPTSNLLGHLAYFAADRYWYSPLVGVCILSSYGLWWLCRKNQTAYLVIGCLVVLTLSWQTWQQQRVWRDAESFYTHMLRFSPMALEGLVGKGMSALEEGDLDVAESFFRQAVILSPSDWRIPQSLGLIAYRQGRYGVALDYFKSALAVNPEKLELHNNLGSLYNELGQPEAAIEVLRQALAINPHFEKGYTNLGVTYERMGNLVEAEALHRQALSESWDYAEAHYNLGVTLYRAQRLDEARESFAMAARLSPEDADTLFNYGLLASETGHQEEAGLVIAKLRRIAPEVAEQLEKEISGEQ